MVKLANRIEALKMQEDDPENSDMPKDATSAANQTRHFQSGKNANEEGSSGGGGSSGEKKEGEQAAGEKRTLSKAIKGAIFREVVMAKVREMKEQEETLKVTGEATGEGSK